MVAAQGSVETDRVALVALYDSTGGETGQTIPIGKAISPLGSGMVLLPMKTGE